MLEAGDPLKAGVGRLQVHHAVGHEQLATELRRLLEVGGVQCAVVGSQSHHRMVDLHEGESAQGSCEFIHLRLGEFPVEFPALAELLHHLSEVPPDDALVREGHIVA